MSMEVPYGTEIRSYGIEVDAIRWLFHAKHPDFGKVDTRELNRENIVYARRGSKEGSQYAQHTTGNIGLQHVHAFELVGLALPSSLGLQSKDEETNAATIILYPRARCCGMSRHCTYHVIIAINTCSVKQARMNIKSRNWGVLAMFPAGTFPWTLDSNVNEHRSWNLQTERRKWERFVFEVLAHRQNVAHIAICTSSWAIKKKKKKDYCSGNEAWSVDFCKRTVERKWLRSLVPCTFSGMWPQRAFYTLKQCSCAVRGHLWASCRPHHNC